jgi:hypothetical protein
MSARPIGICGGRLFKSRRDEAHRPIEACEEKAEGVLG